MFTASNFRRKITSPGSLRKSRVFGPQKRLLQTQEATAGKSTRLA
jgi:hypothetical protein